MAKASAKDKPEDPPASKTKSSTTATATNTGRGRKAAGNGKDNAAAASGQSKSALAVQSQNQSTNVSGSSQQSQSPWSNAPLEVLHVYRSFHGLKIPAAYSNPHSHHILGHGIGRQTPTAAGVRKDKRRVHRESLSMAVRKHFNASAVNENDAIVNTLYRARTGEKSLRLKFLHNSKQR